MITHLISIPKFDNIPFSDKVEINFANHPEDLEGIIISIEEARELYFQLTALFKPTLGEIP